MYRGPPGSNPIFHHTGEAAEHGGACGPEEGLWPVSWLPPALSPNKAAQSGSTGQKEGGHLPKARLEKEYVCQPRTSSPGQTRLTGRAEVWGWSQVQKPGNPGKSC